MANTKQLSPGTRRRLNSQLRHLNFVYAQQEAHLKKVQEVGSLHEQMLAEIALIKTKYARMEVAQFLEVKCK